MTASLIPSLVFRAFDANGDPLAGGFLYSYLAGTTTPQATYTDSTGLIQNPNPVVLDSTGSAEVWLGANPYKFNLFDANMVQQADYPVDNVSRFVTFADISSGGTSPLTSQVFTTQGAGLVGYRFSAAATGRTVQNRLGDTVSLADYLTSAQKADIASYTGSIDCLPAMNAAIADLSNFVYSAAYPVCGNLKLPKGKIFLNGNLSLSASVRLRGHGAGQAGGQFGTILYFPPNTQGIIVNKALSSLVPGADGSIFEGVFLLGQGGSDRTKHGISLLARAKIVDSGIQGFSGNGINIVAFSPDSNANAWVIDTCTSWLNGKYGLFVQGSDSNAGVCNKLDTSTNNGCGIYDNSFLGNTYIGCESAADGVLAQVSYSGHNYYCIDDSLASTTYPGTNSAVWMRRSDDLGTYPMFSYGSEYMLGYAFAGVNPNAPNMFLGCYSEGGGAPSYILSPSSLIQGEQGAGIDTRSSGFKQIGRNFNSLSSQQDKGSTGSYIEVGYDAGGDTNCNLSLNDPNSAYRLHYILGKWYLDRANSLSIEEYYTSDTTIANGYPRDIALAGFGLPQGYYASGLAYRGDAAAIPTTGSWLQRDILFNTNPLSGGFVGWVCVASGTPGTWKTFGAIS